MTPTGARRPRLVCVVALVALALVSSACGGGGGGRGGGDASAVEPDPKKVKTEGVLVAADAKPVDLGGLDTPANLDGKCFDEFVLVAAGKDAAGQPRYTLSFHLKGDPKDTAALFGFLDDHHCGPQQAAAFDKSAKAVGYVQNATAPDPIDLSYVTSSGRRFFL